MSAQEQVRDTARELLPESEVRARAVNRVLQKALADGKLSDAEVRQLIEATYDKGGLSLTEISNLEMILRRSRTMSYRARVLLATFLTQATGKQAIKGMIAPTAREGWAAPDVNFAGKGWSGEFRIRPRNFFDLAAKIHDVAYALNDVEFLFDGVGPFRKERQDELTLSRRAKIDYIFRVMNEHQPDRPGTTGAQDRIAELTFHGRSRDEFVSGDGFVNPLTTPQVFVQLCDPTQYLMIPFDSLSEESRRKSYATREGPQNGFSSSFEALDRRFYATVREDYSPGFAAWFRSKYRGVWGKLAVSDLDGRRSQVLESFCAKVEAYENLSGRKAPVPCTD